MRVLGLLALIALVAAGAEPDRTTARAEAHLKRGQQALDAAKAAKGAGRFHAFGRAVYFLGQSNELATKAGNAKLLGEARKGLVDALIGRGAAYYERKSLPSAKADVLRALQLDPKSARAQALLAAIRKAEDEDIFESVEGVVGIDRVRERRLAAGVPLRDRGVARRR